ncbi:MAG: FkbM family methyltransferase [Anaerolineales bacterium]|nr:FkbM family methyltransferase [Anaerolineales bacterium]
MTNYLPTTIENDDLGLILSCVFFDKEWYLTANPDVAEAKVDPATHFLYTGGVEGRAPGPGFSSRWYLDAYEDVRLAGVNPLIHYLKYGKAEGRIALSLQNVDDLRLIEDSDLFDRDWYLAKYPDVAELKLSPAFHYMYYGGFEGRDPGERFSSAFYLDLYEDVKQAGVNPLVHYLRYGQVEGRIAHFRNTSNLPDTFFGSFLKLIDESMPNWYEDNYDYLRFGDMQLTASSSDEKEVVDSHIIAYGFVKPYLSRFAWLFDKLADNESKSIFLKTLAFRALGYRKVKLPLSTPSYWDEIKKIEQLADFMDEFPVTYLGLNWQLPLINLESIGIPIKFYGSPSGVHQEFILEQYRCNDIQVEAGDVVIDAGACWGETALYFSHRAGDSGQVFSYEFVSENLDVLERNIKLNPNIAGNIHIIRRAIWSESNIRLAFATNGPATCVSANETISDAVYTSTLSIDDLVDQNNLKKVDFIKMDIEGAELQALKGAVSTLKRFKPKLAIAVYHDLKDFYEIPQYLNSLDIGYRFFLRHFSIHSEETILFAR